MAAAEPSQPEPSQPQLATASQDRVTAELTYGQLAREEHADVGDDREGVPPAAAGPANPRHDDRDADPAAGGAGLRGEFRCLVDFGSRVGPAGRGGGQNAAPAVPHRELRTWQR